VIEVDFGVFKEFDTAVMGRKTYEVTSLGKMDSPTARLSSENVHSGRPKGLRYGCTVVARLRGSRT
jgi:hypothetical protein